MITACTLQSYILLVRRIALITVFIIRLPRGRAPWVFVSPLGKVRSTFHFTIISWYVSALFACLLQVLLYYTFHFTHTILNVPIIITLDLASKISVFAVHLFTITIVTIVTKPTLGIITIMISTIFELFFPSRNRAPASPRAYL